MKSVIHSKYGPPKLLKIKSIEKPIPKDDEIIVKIKAITINRTDCAILRAKPIIMRFVSGIIKPRNKTPGTDFAGEIEEVGNQIKKFKVKDKVFGFDDLGLKSHAEYLTIKENKNVELMPKNTSYKHGYVMKDFLEKFVPKNNINQD